MNLTLFSGQRPEKRNKRTDISVQSHALRTLRRLELLRLGSTSNTTVEAPEWNDLLVLCDVSEVGVRLCQLEA